MEVNHTALVVSLAAQGVTADQRGTCCRWERPGDTTFTHTLIAHTATAPYVTYQRGCAFSVVQAKL